VTADDVRAFDGLQLGRFFRFRGRPRAAQRGARGRGNCRSAAFSIGARIEDIPGNPLMVRPKDLGAIALRGMAG
jgi:hypothetical protein